MRGENIYQLIYSVFEVYEWIEWSDEVYKGYFRKFMSLKFKASGFPQGVSTQEEKEAYCARINAKLGLNLRPEDITYSNARRTVAKFLVNSCCQRFQGRSASFHYIIVGGKLAEIAIQRKTEYMSISDFLALLLDSTRKVVDAQYVSDRILLVQSTPRVENVKANPFSAVHHGAYITSYARCYLYLIAERTSEGALYMDTASARQSNFKKN